MQNHGELLTSADLSLQAQDFSKIMAVLFRQVARCLNSSHFQVCTRLAYPECPTLISLGQPALSRAAQEFVSGQAFGACQHCC